MTSRGNKEVVECCKALLAEAQKGDWTHIAVVVTHPPNRVGFGHVGADGKDPVWVTHAHAGTLSVLGKVQEGLQLLMGRIDDAIRQKKSVDGRWDSNLHEYNLATDPDNFDFLVWLIEAEMIRLRHGGTPPLRVKFSHKDALSEKGRLFFENVIRPLLPLIGATEDGSSSGGMRKANFTASELVAAAKRGEYVPFLKAEESHSEKVKAWLTNKPAPITITLREASHWGYRNSNLAAWIRFARDKLKDEYVVFVRDTEKGNEPLISVGTDPRRTSFDTYPSASFNVGIRMALYEQAKMNFFISNGPATMAMFSPCPYLCFVPLYKDEEFHANNPEWWVQHHGIGEGEQWPWSLENQRIVWKRDTYENLCEAWEALGTGSIPAPLDPGPSRVAAC